MPVMALSQSEMKQQQYPQNQFLNKTNIFRRPFIKRPSEIRKII
ncbi:hypothetical protein l11_14020 [Neisseria weaveri LMG 5135]|nr:hypothetical protein l13_17380 [Neisseria weaveri ATCC 51223]EGV37041.1 hypothetical protein l11_14020 [Neisseria weaveri LMG 5135]